MKHFEEQVSQAAARLRNEKQPFACTGESTSVRRRFLGMGGYAGGRRGRSVVGVELGRMSGESSLQQVSQVIDTVIRREVVRDTVYSVRPKAKVASWQVGEKGKRSRRNCTRSPDTGGKPETGTGDETLQARTGKCVFGRRHRLFHALGKL